MTPTERAALQLVRDVLISVFDGTARRVDIRDAIDAIDAALNPQARPP